MKNAYVIYTKLRLENYVEGTLFSSETDLLGQNSTSGFICRQRSNLSIVTKEKNIVGVGRN